ncbi:MAG: hypothetical protein KDI13_10595 [Alphaproteobacteria bacterium]|nr:hypothetical protein [Alphaproteobacteria bacterium]
MSIYNYNPNERYRRRSAQRTANLIFILFLLVAISGISFWFGMLQSEQKRLVLEQEKEQLQKQATELQEQMTKIRAEAQTANIRMEQMRASYEEVIPEGPMQDLTMLLKEQLDEGIDAKRLEFVIRSTRPPQNCSEPENRRFVVLTPAYQGPESKVSILSGAITISGDGESAQNDKGKKEAWFDPARAVKLSFTLDDGATEIREGVLPLRHSIVKNGKEFRFTIAPGTQSFAKVTFDSCDYP